MNHFKKKYLLKNKLICYQIDKINIVCLGIEWFDFDNLSLNKK